jgi:hypothetical protein
MMMMMPTLTVATAHAFVLTVSHGLLFRQPPLTATALLPPLLSISPDCVGRPRRRSHSALFVSDLNSSSNVTSPINRAASAMRPAEFQYSFPRAPSWCARTHEVSRSEHGLNSAILYAVQFGYSASLFCLTCAADLLENHAPGVQGNAAPSFKGDSVGRKLVGSGPHSKCFFAL